MPRKWAASLLSSLESSALDHTSAAAKLTGRGFFIRRVLGHRQPSDLAGIGALAVLANLSLLLPAFVAAIGAVLPLIGVAFSDAVNRRRRAQRSFGRL